MHSIPITSGAGTVHAIAGVSSDRAAIFFTGCLHTPLESHLYRVTSSDLPAYLLGRASLDTVTWSAPEQLTLSGVHSACKRQHRPAAGFNHVVALLPSLHAFVSSFSSLTRPSTTQLFTISGLQNR